MKKFIYLLIILALIFQSFPAEAKKRRSFSPNKYAALIVDARTGDVLHQENANSLRYPASLTKMMTAYLAFEALKKGKLSMNQMLYVSGRAAAQPKTNLRLRKGQRISVKDAVLAIIVKSANDAAVVLAEGVGGTEMQFALLMNKKARKLGMSNTNFQNASGLHNSRQRTTAKDMAKLAIALQRDFPEYYPLFSRTSFTFKGRVYLGHNNVTKLYRGADGIKTGYVRASGFNLVSSASRNGKRLVGVVMGGKTAISRDRRMIQLLNDSFAKVDPQPQIKTKPSSKSKKKKRSSRN